MEKIAFFDAKPYDKEWFDKINGNKYEIIYYESRLRPESARLADGCRDRRARTNGRRSSAYAVRGI